MKELLLQALTLAYGCVGFIGLVAYWSTIKDLYHHKKPSANISSYALWSTTSGISFLYSIFISSDLLFRMVMGINFVACMTVLILSVQLKNYHKKNYKKH